MAMELDGEVVRFNIFEAMRYPSDVHSVLSVDIMDTEEDFNEDEVPFELMKDL